MESSAQTHPSHSTQIYCFTQLLSASSQQRSANSLSYTPILDAMRTLLFLILFSVSFVSTAQEVSRFSLYFESDDFELDDNHKAELENQIAQLINIPAAYSLDIVGHTDNDGNMSYNESLSNRRAKSIASFFGNEGFLRRHMKTDGRAFIDSISSNSDELGKGQNRRVEVSITANRCDISAKVGYKNKSKSYKVETTEPSEVTTETGTVLKIPANAFVDEQGNVIQGEVTINYREFQDPIDFLTSGIPMTLNHNGNFAFYNSAGMFEIDAQYKGNAVDLQAGKEIEVSMEMSQQLNNLNFYEYDETKKAWDTKAVLTSTTGVNLAVPAWRASAKRLPGMEYMQRRSMPLQCNVDRTAAYIQMVETGIKLIKEDRSLLEKFKDDNLYPSTKKRLKDKEWRLNSDLRRAISGQERLQHTYHLVERSTSKKTTAFRLKCKTRKMNEAAEFSSTDFEWNHEQNGVFNAEWFALDWDSCTVDYHKNTKVFTINLLNEDHQATLNVTAVHTSRLVKRRHFAKQSILVMNEYNNTVSDREERLVFLAKERIRIKKEIEEVQDAYCAADTIENQNGLYELECFHAFNMALASNRGEAGLNLEEWSAFFDENHKMIRGRYAAAKRDQKWEMYKVRGAYNDSMALVHEAQLLLQQKSRKDFVSAASRTLKIGNMGIFNADQVCRMESPLIVDAQYQNAAGKRIEPVSIFISDSEFNALIEYNGYMGYSPYHFALQKHSQSALFAMDVDGELYKISKEEFRSYQLGKIKGNTAEVQFTLTAVSKSAKKSDLMAGF